MRQRRPPWSDDGEMVLRVDRWTRYQWGRFCDEQPAVREALEEGAGRYFGYPRLARDLFARLFGDVSERVDRTRPEDEWVVRLHDALDELPEMRRLARRTRGDRTASGQGAMWLVEKALDALPEPPPRDDPQQLREQVEGLVALAGANAGLLDEGLHRSQLEGLREEGRARVAASSAFSAALDDSDLRRALRLGLDDAGRRLDDLEAQIAAFTGWGSSAGASFQADLEVKAGLAQRLGQAEKLRRLAAEAGRLRRIATRKQRGRADHGADEVTDIERGADLGRLLPTELAKLADPMRVPEVARGLAERSMLQFRLRGTDSLGRGPVVVCLDQSSSMEGDREIWSKGLALALLQVATLQRRACRVLHFNDAVVRVDDWAPGRVAPLVLIESMASFDGGGTSFEAPLRSALEAIRSERQLTRADVVLVTDGEAEVSEAFVDEWGRARRQHDFNAYALRVGGGSSQSALVSLMDRVLDLADLQDDAAALDAVLTI